MKEADIIEAAWCLWGCIWCLLCPKRWCLWRCLKRPRVMSTSLERRWWCPRGYAYDAFIRPIFLSSTNSSIAWCRKVVLHFNPIQLEILVIKYFFWIQLTKQNNEKDSCLEIVTCDDEPALKWWHVIRGLQLEDAVIDLYIPTLLV